MPGYDGDAWVTLHRYQQRDWYSLIDLWAALNRQLLVAAEAAPDSAWSRTCTIADSEPLTLQVRLRRLRPSHDAASAAYRGRGRRPGVGQAPRPNSGLSFLVRAVAARGLLGRAIATRFEAGAVFLGCPARPAFSCVPRRVASSATLPASTCSPGNSCCRSSTGHHRRRRRANSRRSALRRPRCQRMLAMKTRSPSSSVSQLGSQEWFTNIAMPCPSITTSPSPTPNR